MNEDIKHLDFDPENSSDRAALQVMARAGSPDAAEIQREYKGSPRERINTQIQGFSAQLKKLGENLHGDREAYCIGYTIEAEPRKGQKELVMTLDPTNQSITLVRDRVVHFYDYPDESGKIHEYIGNGESNQLSLDEEQKLAETLEKLSHEYTSVELVVH